MALRRGFFYTFSIRALLRLALWLSLTAGCAPRPATDPVASGGSHAPAAADCRHSPYEEALPATASHFPASWASALDPRYTRFVQKGPGGDDWTAALQAAIDDLAAGESIPPSSCAPDCARPAAPGAPVDFRNTLFIPAGTYPISRPLEVRTPWIRVLGEDPATTKIVWKGRPYDPRADDSLAPAGGVAESETGHGRVDCLSEPDTTTGPVAPTTIPNNCTRVALDAKGYPLGRSWMFWVDDASAFDLERLTLDGQGTAEVGIRVAATRSLFPATPPPAGSSGRARWIDFYGRYRATSHATGYRFTDLVIQDAARGLWAGVLWHDTSGRGTGSMDSEGDIQRVRFLRIGRQLAGLRPQTTPPGADTSANVFRAAVRTNAQNTMNWNVWESTFVDCDAGIVDASGGGALNAWGNLFVRSRVADYAAAGGYFDVIRGNTSVGSHKFVITGGYAPGDAPGGPEAGDQANQDFWSTATRTGSSLWAHLLIADNVILDPLSTAVDVRSMEAVLLDNVFRASKTPIAEPSGFGYTDGVDRFGNRVLLVGNTFPEALRRPPAEASAYPDDYADNVWWTLYATHGPRSGSKVPSPAAFIEAENRAAPASSLAAYSAPSMPETPRAVPGRTIRELAPGYEKRTDVRDLQGAVEALCARGGPRPILHLGAGVYFVDRTIVIPPACEIQIRGDGMTTRIEWGTPAPQVCGGSAGHDASSNGYIFTLEAPARATIGDLVLGANAPDRKARHQAARALNAEEEDPVGMGILIKTHDLPGDRVYLQKVNLHAAENPWPGKDDFTRDLTLEGQNVEVRVDGSGFGNAAVAVDVDGAGAASRGVRLFGCGSGGDSISSYRVRNGGKLVAQAVEQESTSTIDLRGGSGSFTLAGTRYVVNSPVFMEPGKAGDPPPDPRLVAWRAAWVQQLRSAGDLGYGALHAGDFKGTLALVGVDLGMPVVREAAAPSDLTLIFGVRYAYTGNRTQACHAPVDPGLWPGGLTPVSNPEEAIACRPAFQVSGGSSYVIGSVMTGKPRAARPGCDEPDLDARDHQCRPPGDNRFSPAMLEPLRQAKVERLGLLCDPRNTDVHLESVRFAGYDSRSAVRVQKDR